MPFPLLLVIGAVATTSLAAWGIHRSKKENLLKEYEKLKKENKWLRERNLELEQLVQKNQEIVRILQVQLTKIAVTEANFEDEVGEMLLQLLQQLEERPQDTFVLIKKFVEEVKKKKCSH